MKVLIIVFLSFFISFANDLKDISSFEATFKQEIINNANKKIEYNGKLYIEQPAKILWQYNDPIQKTVYIMDSRVTIVEPDLEQAIVSRLENEINILELLKSAVKISDNKYLSTLYNVDYTLIVKNNKLEMIRYVDNIDNTVFIHLSNVKQNHNLPKDVFKFSIPSYYDIIRK